jgi:hypothetical protein
MPWVSPESATARPLRWLFGTTLEYIKYVGLVQRLAELAPPRRWSGKSFNPISIMQSREEMLRIFDSIYTARELRPSLKVIPVISYVAVESLPSIVKSEARLQNYTLTLKKLEDNLYKLEITKEMRAHERISGFFLVDVRDDLWIILTTGGTYFVKHGIEHLLSTLYPQVARIYINHYEMTQLIKTVHLNYGGSHIITEFMAHIANREDDSSDVQSVRIKGGHAERDLKRYARKQRIWLDKVAFRVEGQDKMDLLESVIYSSGMSRLLYGRFSDFYRNVVGKIIETSEEIDEKYGTVRRDTADEVPMLTPCLLTYQSEFEETSVHSLVRGLGRTYTISVMHGGNPYLAAEVLDVEEGSSFGLTLTGKVVAITPMLRSTRPALWRLTTDIQSVLGEAVVSVP